MSGKIINERIVKDLDMKKIYEIVDMYLDFNCLMEVRAMKHGDVVETPTKKSRGDQGHLKTADSASMVGQTNKKSICDLNAQELFDNFSRIVSVSECNEEVQFQGIYKRLHFGEQGVLNFEESTNSMRKKRRGSRYLSGDVECVKVRPFVLNDCESQSEVCQFANQTVLQDNEQFSELKKFISKNEVMTTPKKKMMHFQNLEIERAAKKQDSFRDLTKPICKILH